MDKDVENAVLALFVLAVTSGNSELANKLFAEQGHTLSDQWHSKAKTVLAGFMAIDSMMEHLHGQAEELKAELAEHAQASAEQQAQAATSQLLSKFKLH